MNTLARRFHPQRIRRTLGAASCVRERAAFVANELRDARRTRQYRLRNSGLFTQVRHPLLDMWGVEEMFRFRVYEPPPPVARALSTLQRPIRIADIGGHVGFFALFMRQLFPDAHIVSFEPDPDNGRLLKRNIEANRLQDRWELVEACAATTDGTVEFASSYHLSRMNPPSDRPLEEMERRISAAFPFMEGTALLQPELRQVQGRDVFPFLADADLVKLDIEGAEWDILADPRFADINPAALVLEYHPTYTSESNPEAVLVRELERAGLQAGEPDRGGDAGMMWAWRESDGRSS